MLHPPISKDLPLWLAGLASAALLTLLALAAGSAAGELRSGATGASARGSAERAFEQEVVERVNRARWRRSRLPPLKLAPELAAAARRHSDSMARHGFFSHCDLETGRRPGELLSAAGYRPRAWAENVAAGQTSPEAVMAVWMESAGHRANILSTTVREIGVGYRFDPLDDRRVRVSAAAGCEVRRLGGPFIHYWTQSFGRRDGVFPLVIEREAAATGSRRVELYVYGDGWAEEMRLFGEGEEPGPWRRFASQVGWQLAPGAGEKTVTVELRRNGRVLSASDSIVLDP